MNLVNCPHCGNQPPLHRWREFVAYQCCVTGDMKLSDEEARESWNDAVEAALDEASELLSTAGYTVTPPLPALAPNTTYANATETYRIDRIDEHGGVWGTWLRHPLITREMPTYSRPDVFERWAKGTGAEVVG